MFTKSTKLSKNIYFPHTLIQREKQEKSIYYCGFCLLVQSVWLNTSKHIQSTSPSYNKRTGKIKSGESTNKRKKYPIYPVSVFFCILSKWCTPSTTPLLSWHIYEQLLSYVYTMAFSFEFYLFVWLYSINTQT